MDGVDVSGHAVGECFEVTALEAALLVAEGWAVVESGHDGPDETLHTIHESPARHVSSANDDRHELTLARTLLRLRELRAAIEQRRQTTDQERRRAEDQIREELRDSRAKTIRGARR